MQKVFGARYAKHPTVAVAGVTHARIIPSTVAREDPGGAGATGRAGTCVTNRGMNVEVYGTNYAALLAMLEAAAANLVIGFYGDNGALRKLTLKSVRFVEWIAPIDIPEVDAGGNKLNTPGIRGMCLWGDSDTFATMMTEAADI
jgi:hypothetical protein